MVAPDTTEAFILLVLNNCKIATPSSHHTYAGALNLECITVPFLDQGGPEDRDVYLVLRLGNFEAPLDPLQPIVLNVGVGERVYRFNENSSLIELKVGFREGDELVQEDLETFDGILGQYAELRVSEQSTDAKAKALPEKLASPSLPAHASAAEPDLRGRLVLINQDNGEVVGQFSDQRIHIQEDPSLHKAGHEGDPVVIEIPEGQDIQQEESAMEMFVKTIPPGEQDFITKGATVISHAISHTTTLLLTTITTASGYYMSRTPGVGAAGPSSTADKAVGTTPGGTGQQQPSRAVMFLSSAKTRKNLATVHAFSGQAVKVSAKTVSAIDGMIKRAVGGSSSSSSSRRLLAAAAQGGMLGPTPWTAQAGSRPVSPVPVAPGAPPPYTEKPPLPPRSPQPGLSGPGTPQKTYPASAPTTPGYGTPPALPPRTLSKKVRVLLSADLILSTLEESAKRLIGGGGDNLNAIVAHKYGAEAAESAGFMTGSAKNVVLVYIDMRGIGRKALIKRVGKEYVRGKIHKK